jgi:uncharacterized membrane protein
MLSFAQGLEVTIKGFIVNGMHWSATLLEIAGVSAILLAASFATLRFVQDGYGADWAAALHTYRVGLGRGILIGLEFLVAADIIGTVAVTPTFQNLGVLGLIIAIRTFLSLALSVELEGQWPWRRAGSVPKDESKPIL